MGGFRDGVLMRRRRKEREGGERGRRERERGVYGFSSLLKQNKKAKICFVIYIAGFFFKKNFCYEVFAKQKKKKCSANNYSCVMYTCFIAPNQCPCLMRLLPCMTICR
jgi:hypothetical protein